VIQETVDMMAVISQYLVQSCSRINTNIIEMTGSYFVVLFTSKT